MSIPETTLLSECRSLPELKNLLRDFNVNYARTGKGYVFKDIASVAAGRIADKIRFTIGEYSYAVIPEGEYRGLKKDLQTLTASGAIVYNGRQFWKIKLTYDEYIVLKLRKQFFK